MCVVCAPSLFLVLFRTFFLALLSLRRGFPSRRRCVCVDGGNGGWGDERVYVVFVKKIFTPRESIYGQFLQPYNTPKHCESKRERNTVHTHRLHSRTRTLFCFSFLVVEDVFFFSPNTNHERNCCLEIDHLSIQKLAATLRRKQNRIEIIHQLLASRLQQKTIARFSRSMYDGATHTLPFFSKTFTFSLLITGNTKHS